MPTKTTKLRIEDVTLEVLSGEVQQTALDFISYLRKNSINPAWLATNAWKITYKTFTVCFIRLHGAAENYGIEEGAWQVIPLIGEHETDDLPDDLREIVWANIKVCANCGKCALKLKTVFGKKFDYACEKCIVFNSPEEVEIHCIKKLIELRRSQIAEGRAKKHVYVPYRDR